MLKAILFKSVATMHNGMSKFKSPMIRNQKLSISLAVLPRFECAKHQNGPFHPCWYCGWSMLKAILFKSVATMHNGMSKFKSPMIRNQNLSISLAVLPRFEWAKHQNGPFQPCRYCGDLCWKRFCSNRSLQCITACPSLSPQWSGIKTEYISCSIATIRMRQASKWPVSPLLVLWWSMLKAILFKSVATMHNGMSKFKSPMIRNQNWVYLLQYCHDSNAAKHQNGPFHLVSIVVIYVESDSVQIGRYNA